MKKILKKVITKKVITKWKMGLKLVFKKYDEESITFIVNKMPVVLLFRDIVSLRSDGNKTIYYLSNGKCVIRRLGLRYCCLDLPCNHFGRYHNTYVMNFHFYQEHSLKEICVVKLFGGFSFVVSRYERERFYEDEKRYTANEKSRIIRLNLKNRK
jgi:hypothetical protein